MYPVSDRFLQAIDRSGKRRTVVDLYYDNYPILTDVPIISGTIKVDRTARCRRSGTLQLADPQLFPSVLRTTGISPYGVEARVRSGVRFPNNTEELVPLGTFIVYSTKAELESGYVPTIELFDRAQRVYETSSWAVGDTGFNFGGKHVTEAIEQLVMYAAPYWPAPIWTFDVNPLVTPKDRYVPPGAYAGDTDRWKMVQDLSLSIDAETYFDMEGTCKVAPIKYLPFWWAVQDVEWTASALVSAAVGITRENTYNSVIVVGSSKDSDSLPPFYVAYDDDGRSPTYWNGYFGKKTYRHEDQTLTTLEECSAVALSKLATLCGLSQTISFDCIQNPALDAGDIINVPLNGEDNVLMVESISLPLHTGIMSVDTRSVQYVKS